MPRIIVERSFDTPLTEEELKATEARMAPSLSSIASAGSAVAGPPIARAWSASTKPPMPRVSRPSSARPTPGSIASGRPTSWGTHSETCIVCPLRRPTAKMSLCK